MDPVTRQRPTVRIGLTDGAELACWTQPGPAGSPHVVLLHGGPGLWDYLEPVAQLLAGAATVHRYDQRGCGDSSPSQEQTISRAVADLEELRRHWGAGRLLLVGHSFGAALALAWAATHPDRAAGVVCLAGIGLGDWRTPYRAELAARRAPWADRWAFLGQRERDWEEEVEWRRLTWASDYADPEVGLELARPMAETRLSINYHANRALMGEVDADLAGWAAGTRCPVTFVHGSADPRPVEPVLALAARVGRARRRVVQGGGHLPWVEQPEETAGLLHEALPDATA